MPQTTRPMAKNPSQAPMLARSDLFELSRWISPQPCLRDMYQQADCIATTMMIPGIMPPRNRSLIERFIRKPYTMKMMLGGMMMPTVPPAAAVAAAKFSS